MYIYIYLPSLSLYLSLGERIFLSEGIFKGELYRSKCKYTDMQIYVYIYLLFLPVSLFLSLSLGDGMFFSDVISKCEMFISTYSLIFLRGIFGGESHSYWVATIGRLLQIIGLFCRIQSLLLGSFAKETYNLEEPTNRRHSIHMFMRVCKYIFSLIQLCGSSPNSLCKDPSS